MRSGAIVPRDFADSAKVHAVHHDGSHYRVNGIHLAEPSPQRTPLLYQAGTSKRGRAFAARHAEAIFLNGQTKSILARAAREIRSAAKEFGRDPYDIKLFAGATVIVAPTRAEAEDLLEDYARHVDQAGQLALLSGWTGIDFSTYQPDQAVQYVESNAIQSMVENFTLRSDRPVRIGDLATLSRVGARSPFVVGSPQDVADELIAWADETDVDGFNLFRLVMPETLNAFVDLVVPELQSRGVYKTSYREGTLREKLFPGRGAACPRCIRPRAFAARRLHREVACDRTPRNSLSHKRPSSGARPCRLLPGRNVGAVEALIDKCLA